MTVTVVPVIVSGKYESEPRLGPMGVCSKVAIPASHLPVMWALYLKPFPALKPSLGTRAANVRYPAVLSFDANPVILRGIPA